MVRKNFCLYRSISSHVLFKAFFLSATLMIQSLLPSLHADNAADFSTDNQPLLEKRHSRIKQGPRGHRGKRGHQGHTGKMGTPGAAGADGIAGPAGATGATGPTGSALVVQPFRLDVFVDANYPSVNPTGSINNPFTDIPSAINYVLSQPASIDPNEVYTILIAGSNFSGQDITINQTASAAAGQKKINLLALGHVLINSLTWNFDENDTHPALSIRSINTGSNDSVGGFTIQNGITVNSTSATMSGSDDASLELHGIVGGDIDLTMADPTYQIDLFLADSNLLSVTFGQTSGNVIVQSAKNCLIQHFSSFTSYGTIESCYIVNGMAISQTPDPSLSPSGPIGMFGTRCGQTFVGSVVGSPVTYYIDPATNGWFTTNNPLGAIQATFGINTNPKIILQ